MIIAIKHVNAFTSQPFVGNPAAVVMKADGLADVQMLTLAREMNLSETAFVLKPTSKKADLRLRWFTPTEEVDFCGHATVASLHALAEEGRLGMKTPKRYTFRLETRAGILQVEVLKRSVKQCRAYVQVPKPAFSRYLGRIGDILEALGIAKQLLNSDLPVQIDQRRFLYLPVGKLSTLFDAKPNFDRLRAIGERDHVQAVCAFTIETVEPQSHFHSRFFAPNCGINEDPVTGSSNGPLAAYLYTQGALKPQNGKCIAVGEQGDVLGRKGRVSVELVLNDRRVDSVRIGGEAVTLFDASLKI